MINVFELRECHIIFILDNYVQRLKLIIDFKTEKKEVNIILIFKFILNFLNKKDPECL